ncbi:hypothetical protein PGUG_03283 [Meyerozyma guilliermondii ATCC 6260]|uniref:Uncharacterized protein n=1 Tax=Meyerozyma guilliermondii (strain ATCC 6260 / CBS 566 / DSM 6381 / JCM 1539 / NBRC 10279 / NRRL Y-324) TaxID=294746 RepID=A5DJ32_PICGU|nr:uncharacterized protein PGUG_03283 [Meyerozyma guilliermondii ATCC 6260]EDK39184.2 hypothetical protein PGUG_03283 [Meyerozyma guilliermondii ATCC 6260]
MVPDHQRPPISRRFTVGNEYSRGNRLGSSGMFPRNFNVKNFSHIIHWSSTRYNIAGAPQFLQGNSVGVHNVGIGTQGGVEKFHVLRIQLVDHRLMDTKWGRRNSPGKGVVVLKGILGHWLICWIFDLNMMESVGMVEAGASEYVRRHQTKWWGREISSEIR